MNVLQMIKMFGWQTKIAQHVQERQERELMWTKIFLFGSLSMNHFKYVDHALHMVVSDTRLHK